MNRAHSPRRGRRPATVAPTLKACFDALMVVANHDGYANLALADALNQPVSGRQPSPGEATELTFGTCRLLGTHDRIIEHASGRRLDDLQPEVVALLRLTSHRLLAMSTPSFAAVNESVALARAVIGERVTGLVNAVGRKIAAHDLAGWLDLITADLDPEQAWAVRLHHPGWIAQVHRALLGRQAEEALAANNVPATATYVVRPGLIERDQVAPPEQFTPFSPHGFTRTGAPRDLAQVRAGTVGIQDEGSQLVALALAAVADADLPWLDLCAGPGGKAALLVGLARQRGTRVVANELQAHRAALVSQGLRAYPDGHQVVTGDGTQPSWPAGSFAAAIADVPCTGLGALRRRPEARWRKQPADLTALVPLQRALLDSALDSVRPQGVVAYVTCSPHPDETVGVVGPLLAARDDVEVLDAPAVLSQVPDCALPAERRFVQLWPHRHGTDAMFLALLRRR